MNIASALSTAIWKRLFLCSLLVIAAAAAAAAIATVRLTYLKASPTTDLEQLIAMAWLRLGMLLTFHTAPISWGYLICNSYKQKLIAIPIYQVMLLLRVPLATWTSGCLVVAIFMWPMLGG